MAFYDKPATSPICEVQSSPSRHFWVNIAPRVLLFAASLAVVILMFTSNQIELVPVPGLSSKVKIPVKFYKYPALIFLVAALSAACLYSIITTFASLSFIWKPLSSKRHLLLFAILDILMLVLVTSATGATGGFEFMGSTSTGNAAGSANLGSLYAKYRLHVETATLLSFFANFLLLCLSMLSTFSLYKRIHD